MRNKLVILIALAIIAASLSGCLTVEMKNYRFQLTGLNSGVLTIEYYNIMSMMDDTLDISDEDFDELISSYVYGDQLESEYPEVLNLTKEFYEEDDKLCARVVIEFDDLSDVRLFKYSNDCPYMMNIAGFLEGEYYYTSNGSYGGENMPVVFWEPDLGEFLLTTSVTEPDETTISLIENYRSWKGGQE